MLLQRVVSQDQAALRLLFDRYAAWLTLRLRRRTSDNDVVATVLQDTFVAVWRTAGKYRGDGDVGAWLWGIAIRRMISHYRGHQEPRPASSHVIHAASTLVASAEDELLVGVEHGDVGLLAGMSAWCFDGPASAITDTAPRHLSYLSWRTAARLSGPTLLLSSWMVTVWSARRS
jgi:hypothetical protein